MNRREFFKLTGKAAVAVAGYSLLTQADVPAEAASKKRKPNIVFILGDDLGWAELGCYGNKFNETPNLDKLAMQGIRFTRAYAPAPVCSPTRASFITGQWPARVGITDYLRPNDKNHLSTDQITIPKMLKRAGYVTGLIGKWHLTGYKSANAVDVPPSEHGFDEVIFSETHGIGGGSYFFPYHWNPNIKQRIFPKEYLVDRQNMEAVEFIERHKDQPFFLFVSHYAPHTDLLGKPDLVKKYEAKPGAGKGRTTKHNNPHLTAMLESMDEGVGMIAKKLDELGLTQDTILIFTSDNGGETTITENDSLRSGKSSLYEGGLREPMIVRYPGVTPTAKVCDAPVCLVDFYPTFLEAAGIKPDPKQKLDGESLLPVLRKPASRLKRDTLYWHYPLKAPHFLGGRSSGAILHGDWKLIEFFDDKHVELYSLKSDPGEKTDLSKSEPTKATELLDLLHKWQKDVGAKFEP